MKQAYSRRFTCQHCQHKGRVSKDKRAKMITCPVCKRETKANEIKKDIAKPNDAD